MRRRGHKDIVTPEVRAFVLRRDGECLAHKFDASHVCRDIWGTPHSPYDMDKCSLEHVKSELRLGRRAESDPAHLVALCAAANIGVPSKALRTYMRAYLASVNGTAA